MTTKPERAFVLRMAPSEIDRVEEGLDGNFITIGWSNAGSILRESDWWKFRETVHQSYYHDQTNYRRAGQAGGYLWQFLQEMKEGDWVVVPHGNEFYVCEVASGASHDPSKAKEDTAFRRQVRWLNRKQPIKRSHASAALQSRMKIQGTCAYAQDLTDDILSVLQEDDETRNLPKELVFGHDLHRKLVETTIKTIRSGKLDSFGFERLLQQLFTKQGAEATIVARSQDKGADLKVTLRFAVVGQVVIGVQAKHYQPEPPVPAQIADDLKAGMEDIGADIGMIISSGTMSPELEARVEELYEKESVRIQLVDGDQLAAWLVESGLSNLP